MFLPVGVVLVLSLTASVTNGQETTYSIINMTEAKPYNEIPCQKECDAPLNTGLDLIKVIFGSVLKHILFPVDFCNNCQLNGLDGFSYEHTCFMSPNKDVYDHYISLKFPHFSGNCECDFKNNPSEAAAAINKGKLIEGQCGMEGYKNTKFCKPIVCDQGNDQGESHVKLAADLPNAKIDFVLRVDPRKNPVTKKEGAFPIHLSMTTSKPAVITHEASAEFDEAWKCIKGNDEGFTCRLFANAPAFFFECLTPKDDANVVHSIFYLYGKC